MARGEFFRFDESKAYMSDGSFNSSDDIKCAILDNTVTPAAGDTTPALADYTEVGTGGNYVAGGTSLGTLISMIGEAAGTMTFDSATNPTYAIDAGNDIDAYWALVYNDTDSGKRAIGFLDLGGPVDTTFGLNINWNVLGLYTKT